jgi:hypothetical protein
LPQLLKARGVGGRHGTGERRLARQKFVVHALHGHDVDTGAVVAAARELAFDVLQQHFLA